MNIFVSGNMPMKRLFFLLSALVLTLTVPAQQDSTAVRTDSTKQHNALKINVPDPSVIRQIYEYDPARNVYIKKKVLDQYTISYPEVLTPKEYYDLMLREEIKKNFKRNNDALAGKIKAEDAQKNILPVFYVNNKFFQTIFGGNEIKFEPKGDFALDLGVRYSKRDNPMIPVRNRSNFGLDLNQHISMGLTGHVGKNLNLNLNYDTKSMFNFNNQMKLNFNPGEDDILQKIEVGNVSMQSKNTLIKGAQNLMGLKTVMKFGNTEVTLVGAEQKSSVQTVQARGGDVMEDFEKDILHYDENRHFFLSQYFREHYDEALKQYPYIDAPVRVTRVEVWITNRNSNPQKVRNIVAIQDLGESSRLGLSPLPAGFVTQPGTLPDNVVNKFNPEAIGTAQSVLNDNIRNISTVSSGFNGIQPVNGKDYVALENAVKLDSSEYVLHPKLGYISLRRKLNPDEVLAVAFEYTKGNEVHRVGEFTDNGVVYPQALVVKLLKSNIVDTNEPSWDLMMKNIYSLNTYGISPDDFRMQILYNNPPLINYINPQNGTALPQDVKDHILLNVFHMDELNTSNDPQTGGDGFFDFIDGITVDARNSLIIFTTAEPFGRYLFEKLRLAPTEDYNDPSTWNDNQKKYVFRELYTLSQSRAEQYPSKDKFLLKGKYKSSSGGGISLGGFGIPRGSVHVTAGGRELVEGVDYVVNYQAGRVEIINPALKASNIPIQVSVEQNNLFQQTTKIFTGIEIQHKFSDNFYIGASYLHLKEKPITWKADYGHEPLNNILFGLNGAFSHKVNFLTKWVNYLPNIKTDVDSKFSVKGEFAYLKPGLADISNINGESATLIEDFESSQTGIDLMSPFAWKLASVPATRPESQLVDNLDYGKGRALFAWYVIDNVFYNNPPQGITQAEMDKDENRRVSIREIFDRDIPVGQTAVVNTLNLAYFPDERGPYNFDTNVDPATGKLLNPDQRWGGMMRALTTTDFEQANVQYVTFWVMDPYFNHPGQAGNNGKIELDLGYIKEDILYDGHKQYENGLPADGGTANTTFTHWGKVPLNQSMTYTFSTDPTERENQDVGLDGLKDAEEQNFFADYLNALPPQIRTQVQDDPSNDDFVHFLSASGGVVDRYKKFNNTEGNTPVNQGQQTNGNDVYPDTEDIDRDQTMNNIDAYYEYEIPFNDHLDTNSPYVADVKETTFTDASNHQRTARWIQFKIPVTQFTRKIGNISDFRSIKFMRLFVTGFSKPLILRFAKFDLIRSEWRNYQLTLDPADPNPDDDGTQVEVTTVSAEENQSGGRSPYVSPPGIHREEMYQNNQLIRQNEQALSMRVCGLEVKDARGVFKYNSVDMRQFKRMKMFIHAEDVRGQMQLQDGEMVGFLRFGSDLTDNYYEVRIPLRISDNTSTDPEEVWPLENRIDLKLALLQKIKLDLIARGQANPQHLVLYNEDQLDPSAANKPNKLVIGIKGNPDFARVKIMMVGIRNNSNREICGEAWFNELRLTGMKNKGGWATQGSADLTLADVATFNFGGGISTAGFGMLEQGPVSRSVENRYNYNFNTAINMGKFLPEKWHITLPVSYTVTKEFIRPEYDPVHRDILLSDRLAIARSQQERDSILEVAQDRQYYKSIALTGVKKEYAPPKPGSKKKRKKHLYDIENFTFNFSYAEANHTNFEVEENKQQQVNFGVLYSYNFKPKSHYPLKKIKSKILRKRYMRFLKNINFNWIPSSVSFNTDFDRRFNTFRVRQLEDYGLDFPPMQSRDYKFNLNYNVNYNPFKSMQITYTGTSNRTIKNFYLPNGMPDYNAGIWQGFFDVGQPFIMQQNFNLTYKLPFKKFPLINFIDASYTYNGSFQWQRRPEAMQNVHGYDLGNQIQNAGTHRLNVDFNMKNIYDFLGLSKLERKWSGKGVRKRSSKKRRKKQAKKEQEKNRKNKQEEEKIAKARGKKIRVNFVPNSFQKSVASIIHALTSIRRIRLMYSRNTGSYIPGYLQSVGILGTEHPDIPYVLGWDEENIRYELARRGWLTAYPDLNEPYRHTLDEKIDIGTNFSPFRGLKIDVKAMRMKTRNRNETFQVNNGQYQPLVPTVEGNFSVSYFMMPTAFETFDINQDPTVDRMKADSYIIARRLARQRGLSVPASGYPDGYGEFQTDVLLYSFIAAFTKRDPAKMKLDVFNTFPVPGWKIKYTGLMKNDWFKKHFRRFSLEHGYKSDLTINRFRNNMEFFQDPAARDIADNFYSPLSYGNVVMTEAFNPLIRVQMEMNNSLQIDLSYKKDRMATLNTENYTLTRVDGREITVGLGYRIKDVYLPMNIGGNHYDFKSDLILKSDISYRYNMNIIYGLAQQNTQPVSGKRFYSIRLSADYALTKALSAILFYEHTFSKFEVSNSYPVTNIRGGITIKYSFGQ